MNNRYLVVIEQYEQGGFGAYVPDLTGCVAAASTRPEIEQSIAEGISLHIESLGEHDNVVPKPSSQVEYIEPLAVA